MASSDSFQARLHASAERAGSWLCVGLDPEPAAFPDGMAEGDVLEFCLGIVEATASVACAVKPNCAFFEALGNPGHEALAALMERMPAGLPVILDGKRNDIGNTARKYAEAAFDELGADAVTVNPYLGADTVEPFAAAYPDRGVFLLARTSNASAGDLQDLLIEGAPLHEHVVRKALEWNARWGNLGLVAGATYPAQLARIRALCGPDMPLLIPGVGAQGADAAQTLQAGGDAKGRNAVVNVGRAILQAGKGPDWRKEAAHAARRFADQLRYSR